MGTGWREGAMQRHSAGLKREKQNAFKLVVLRSFNEELLSIA